MGISIRYHGRLDDPCVLPQLLADARYFCFRRKWKYVEVDDRIIGTLDRWQGNASGRFEVFSTPIDDIQRGLLIQLHRECDTLCLTFNQAAELCLRLPQPEPGYFWETRAFSVVTPAAPVDIHISICELLHLIQDRHFPGLVVEDDGEYYTTGDPAHLADRIARRQAIEHKLLDAIGEMGALEKDSADTDPEATGAAPYERSGRRKRKRVPPVWQGDLVPRRYQGWTREYGWSANRN